MRDHQTIPYDVRHFADKYITGRLPHQWQRADNRHPFAFLSVVNNLHFPWIIVGTTAMIQNHITFIRVFATHLTFDEAELIPEVLWSTYWLISPSLPDSPYWWSAPITRLPRLCRWRVAAAWLRKLPLTNSFGAHPILTKCFSVASYQRELQRMLLANDRPLLTASTIQLPIHLVPVVLLHLPGSTTTAGVSRCNSVQESAACRIFQQHVPTAIIAILSFHTGTKGAIRNQLQDFFSSATSWCYLNI